jgi:predicted AlkP superfamily pyrophosphatase or phosphodiesterase
MPYENGVDFIHTFAYNKLGDLYHINKVPTIFDYLSQSGLKGAYLADKIEVVHKLLCNNKFHNNFDFLLAHTLDELDILAHKEGPKSLKVLAYLKSQDALIVKLLEDIRKTHAPEEIVYLLFSDHGMVEVSNYIDISELTHEASKRNIKFFADSTVFRAWGSNDDLGFIYDFMKHQPDVTCLCEKEKKELKINFDNNIYGDVIFAAEPGSVFLPNFFDGQNKVKGMHGYAGSHQDLLPMLILNGRGFNASGKRGRIQMPDIFATILKLLEIEIPSNCEGEPII